MPASKAKDDLPENIVLTEKDKELLESLSKNMKLKPSRVLTRALELLKQAEDDKKYFGAGKLREGA